MQIQALGDGRALSYKEAILIILSMVGSDMEAQLNPTDRPAPIAEQLDVTTVVTSGVAAAAAAMASQANQPGRALFRFGRNAPTKEVKYDDSLKHQCAIHGMSLSVSLILRDLPSLPGGLPRDIVDALMSVANTDHRSKRFTKDHEMMCVEALLTSVVGFLRYCSELLLSIPDALSRVSIILENLLPVFFGKGKFAAKPANPIAAARLESAKASLLEAFAWLPPGSYPMVADSVFGFAAFHIQSSIQNDVVCSILPSLISKEDEILDAVSFSRATRLGQVGGAKDLESDIIAVSSEFSFPGDRESASAEGLGFLATLGVKEDMHFLQSSVLHSLDEIISGASTQGQGRNVVQDDVQAGRSGGLLTLACMQRNSYQIRERRNAKSRLRGSPGNSKDDSEDSLPIIQIMIRLLPYITGASSPGVSLTARTFALHAHLLLLEYSKVFKQTSLIDEDIHLLKKSVEIVEDNFLSAWTVASQMLDQGNDGGKVAFEPSFAAVVLRLMTFLVPFLYHLDEEKSEIGRRFSMMGIIIQECLGSHPVVQAAESVYSGDAVTGRDIADVVRFLLYLESESAKKPESILLRFLLLARSLVSGPSGSGDDDDEEEEFATTNTVTQVTKIANNRASLDCQPVFDFASPIRWQVKSLAVQTANIALVEIRRKSQQKGARSLIESPNFNPKVAALELSKARLSANGSVSASFLSLHISEVVTASCVAAIATVDQVDLRILQENAMHLLSAVVDSFGAIPDPNELDTSVLNEYVPQLSSCIKSALAAKDEDFNGMSCRLFWAGCEGLRCFIVAKVTDDKGVLKRILRPVMLSKAEVPFFEADSALPHLQSKSIDKDDSDTRSSLLVQIGKVWSVGNLPMEDPEVLAMLEADVASLGVHSAAVALDGARLLLSNNMTLVGVPSKQSTESKIGFFLFGDITEIDDYVKSALVKTWANCLESAVKFLGKAIVTSDTDASISEACSKWLKVVVPFAFAGVFDSVKAGSSDSSVSWARDIASTDIACSCLSAICILAETKELMELDEAWGAEIETLLIHLYKKVISPIVMSRSSG
ncbi:MAG: hypothetical protein SGILL_005800, partial [Bacillariaceae sp.]